jgi:hypothetical protein
LMRISSSNSATNVQDKSSESHLLVHSLLRDWITKHKEPWNANTTRIHLEQHIDGRIKIVRTLKSIYSRPRYLNFIRSVRAHNGLSIRKSRSERTARRGTRNKIHEMCSKIDEVQQSESKVGSFVKTLFFSLKFLERLCMLCRHCSLISP